MKILLQVLIDNLRSGNMTVDEIRPYLQDTAAVVRGHAIEAMAAKIADNPSLLQEVVDVILDQNNSIRLMGTISVAHVGLKSLVESSSLAANQKAKQLLVTWPEPDRGDFLWFLKSEGVSVV